jgi:hypothetical protein
MDLDLAAGRIAAYFGATAQHNVDHVRRELESVARATADAIADKIERADPAPHYVGLFHAGMHAAANIARSHGSQAQTTEDGQ